MNFRVWIGRFKAFTLALCAMLFALSHSASAQHLPKVARIGFLTTTSAADPLNVLRLDAFRQGLRELGYTEGKNVYIEFRYADWRSERLPGLVDELVRLKVDILFAANATVARAAKESNVTIP